MSYTVWLTGLPAAGKTTLAKFACSRTGATLMDGDIIRNLPISCDLGFSRSDRMAHLLRVASVCEILNRSGASVIAAFVSPYEEVRKKALELIPNPYLVYVQCALDVCKNRDPKGLYAAAERGEISNFTGIDDVYEIPMDPDLVIDTEHFSEVITKAALLSFILNDIEGQRYEPNCVFIGRWSPFHRGHYELIQSQLENSDDRVLILIRPRLITEEDPWTAYERKQMIDSVYEDEPRVRTQILDGDVGAVLYGRNVGYDVDEISISLDVSGTDIRSNIRADSESWKRDVPSSVADFITKHRGFYE